ncbi:zinc-finger-containing protein [Acinetobacter proteolyticus]|uniref:Uncharacterized protein n=1 Tax=Acinetobacter proteolyticus TaxID=1776741 RepID=A0A2N0WIB3_9GAMM|nr:zinc-finger-containing protein [Acinetobacter proteolyticus]MBK5646245.1 hypothetical protein [Acinetobacter sp.]PKF35506.1 hypothetical protein CW311_04245 [Acinetobacter proteolyticus]
MTNPICPYCESTSELVKGSVIYPKRPDLADLDMYQCAPCSAYVGCHEGTLKPLGRLANAELRQWKMNVHKVFDPLWRSGAMKRGDAYKALAEEMGIERKDCHVGMFSVDQCKQAYAICKKGALIGALVNNMKSKAVAV